MAGTAQSGLLSSLNSTLILTAVIVLGIVMTFCVSSLLSRTVLKGVPSSFTLELPPYRRPQIGKVIVRSICDRTLFVLGRAVVAACRAADLGFGQRNIGGLTPAHCTRFLDPCPSHRLMVRLMGFILGFPANEIVFASFSWRNGNGQSDRPTLSMALKASCKMVDVAHGPVHRRFR
ncbi:MAG: hypothetical protein ACLUVV_02520 [Christensenellales bacterium]